MPLAKIAHGDVVAFVFEDDDIFAPGHGAVRRAFSRVLVDEPANLAPERSIAEFGDELIPTAPCT